MPTYEYLCADCGSHLEMRATITEKAGGLAPRCALCEDGGRVRRVFSTVPMIGGGPVPTRAGPPGGGCCGGGCGCG